MENIISTLNNIVSHIPWQAIAASGIISPLLVGIRKWFNIKSKRVLIFLVSLMSAGAVTVNYLLRVPTSDPSILAIQASVVAFMTQPIYHFVVKPGFAWFADTIEAAALFKSEVRSAALPQSGVISDASVQTTTPVVDDFTH